MDTRRDLCRVSAPLRPGQVGVFMFYELLLSSVCRKIPVRLLTFPPYKYSSVALRHTPLNQAKVWPRSSCWNEFNFRFQMSSSYYDHIVFCSLQCTRNAFLRQPRFPPKRYLYLNGNDDSYFLAHIQLRLLRCLFQKVKADCTFSYYLTLAKTIMRKFWRTAAAPVVVLSLTPFLATQFVCNQRQITPNLP